jgi:hypothetical protein
LTHRFNILPLDIAALQTKMFGWTGALMRPKTAELAAAKQVIRGLERDRRSGVPRQKGAFGRRTNSAPPILWSRGRRGYTIASLAEKSRTGAMPFRTEKTSRAPRSCLLVPLSATESCCVPEPPEPSRSDPRDETTEAARLKRLSALQRVPQPRRLKIDLQVRRKHPQLPIVSTVDKNA